MSIGAAWTPAVPVTASAAGVPLAGRAADAESSRQASSAQEHRAKDAVEAETAAGVGATDGEEHETADRDADGRKLWERPLAAGGEATAESAAEPKSESIGVKDPSGELGGELDLSG